MEFKDNIRSLDDVFYHKHDDDIDKQMFIHKIDYFQYGQHFASHSGNSQDHNPFEFYDQLQEKSKNIFRSIMYKQPIAALDCSKEEFLELLNFLKYISLEIPSTILPAMKRYLYEHVKSDLEFAKATAHIHQNTTYIFGKNTKEAQIDLYCTVLNIPLSLSWSEKRSIFARYEEMGTETKYYLHGYALFLEYGIGGPKDINKIRELYWINWQRYHYPPSLSDYAWCLFKGWGGPRDTKKARELVWFNWEKNRHTSSLYKYALFLKRGIGGPQDKEKASELFLMGWNECRHAGCLHNYAECLFYGIGDGPAEETKAIELFRLNAQKNNNLPSILKYAHLCTLGFGGLKKDEVSHRELHWIAWEQHHHIDSLYKYAVCLEEGIGGPKDETKARELFWLNWEKNRDIGSLHSYALCLQHGKGGPKDETKAQELFKLVKQ